MSPAEDPVAPAPAPGGVDALQFETAEAADTREKCTLCSTPIDDQYFHLSGSVICPSCAGGVSAGQGRPSHALVLRGALFGAVAAFCACLAYGAFTYFTGMEFGLISILVGLAIGRAARTGSQGLGGRRMQMIAVALTYLSITTSYIPLLVKAARESDQQEAAQAAKGGQKHDPRTPVAAPEVSGAGLVIGLVVIWAVSLAVPFLALSDGVSGLIGLAILFFGLSQAWRQTARDERLLSGPYSAATADA